MFLVNRIFTQQTTTDMEEKIKNLIAELKEEMVDYQAEAQEMLVNADVNNSSGDAEDYGFYQGKAEMLELIIAKLEAL